MVPRSLERSCHPRRREMSARAVSRFGSCTLSLHRPHPSRPSVARAPYYKGLSRGGHGPYVLVEAEEVVRVIATLERLEPVVLLCPVEATSRACARYY
jgi:hypothetical protein